MQRREIGREEKKVQMLSSQNGAIFGRVGGRGDTDNTRSAFLFFWKNLPTINTENGERLEELRVSLRKWRCASHNNADTSVRGRAAAHNSVGREQG